MNKTSIIVGTIMLVLGAASLVYGGFTYTDQDTAFKLGPVEVDVQQDKRVNVPVWAGALLAISGGVLVGVGARRR